MSSIRSIVFLTALAGAMTTAQAAVTKTELAGHARSAYPHFEYVKAINANVAVEIAIDPSRFPAIAGKTCDIYVVNKKKTLQWDADQSLTDVTTGGKLTQTFSATSIQANTVQVAAPMELSANAGTDLGVGYDVVLDCNQDATLNGDDYIDGRNNEAGFYRVHDTTAPGPLTVTEQTYNLSSAVGTTFGIPGSHLAENLFYPTNIASMGQLPLIVISHGNGHSFDWYDHLGSHLASYGYIVMSIANNTGPGSFNASTTTLGHTDAFINQVAAGVIAGGALTGHLDANRIVWIGHSRGGEGVAIAYDRMFDATHVPANYDRSDIKLISSMLPTDWYGSADVDPHDANYHLWTASGDSDVNGAAHCALCQTYHLHDRATRHRQSTTVQGTGHAWFHNGGGGSWFFGPCSIGQANTHLIELGHFLPLIKRYVEDNIPSIDFLTRQYESFRPIGVPTGNACIVVSHEYYDGSAAGTAVIDNYQTQAATTLASGGGAVTFTVDNLVEGLLNDNNGDFAWMTSDPFNGAIQGDSGGIYSDTSRGVVFDWTGADKYYEWEVPVPERDFTDNLFLSLRGAQGTRHPNTLAQAGDLTLTVTLRDSASASSSINIGAFGGGLEKPYDRGDDDIADPPPSGWHNEMETIRIRLTDFLNNGSGLNLGNIVAVRLNVGPSWGSPQGRIVIDDLALSNDRAVYDGKDNGDPHITTVNGVNYDFHSAGEFTLLRDGEMEIQARQTAAPSAPPIPNAHTGLASCVSVNTAVAARVAGRRVTYQPGLSGNAQSSGMELRVDGALIDINAVGSVALGSAARVARSAVGGGIEIDFPDGASMTVVPGWWNNLWYLNLSVSNTPATDGVMGLVSVGDWLPRLPDGSSMGPRPASDTDRHNDLNTAFADAWRVAKATSLFDYAPGMSTADFTDRTWPAPPGSRCDVRGAPPIEPIERNVAERLCAPVNDRNDRENCVFDVVQTGEAGFAKTYLVSQRLAEGATRTELHADKDRSRAGDKATFVAVVKNRKSGARIEAAQERAAGAVQFMLDGSRFGKPLPLDAFGRATMTTDRLKPGEHRISAVYLPAKAEAGPLRSVSLETLHVVVGRDKPRKDRTPDRQ